MVNDILKRAVDFAFSNAVIDKHLKWRYLNDYTPVGIDVRYAHFRYFNQNLIRIQFDYEKQGSPETMPEDFVVFLSIKNSDFEIKWIGAVHEVPA